MTATWLTVLKKHYTQILFVFLSFAVMVGASYFFIFSHFDQTDSRNTGLLAVVGFVLAVFLSRLLFKLSEAKMRLAEESSEKSTFLAHISHEFRTPLNSIIGLSELVLREDLPAYMQDHLLSIKRSGEDLLSIINDVMDLAVLEPGKAAVVASEYSFADVVTCVFEIVRTLVKGKPVRFVAKIDGTLPSVLLGDETRVRQIFLILLSNAVQSIREGSVTWTVSGLKANNRDGTKKIFLSSVITEDRHDAEETDGLESGALHFDICKNLCGLMNGQLTKSVYGSRTSYTTVIPQQIVDGGVFARVENADKKIVAVYEQKAKNIESIEFTLQNLGIRYAVVHSKSELQSFFLEEDSAAAKTDRAEYFVFAPSGLIHEAAEILKESNLTIKFVMIAELGNSLKTEGIVPLLTPVHPLAAAKILNGADDFLTRPKARRRFEAFVAPNASALVVDDIATNLNVASGLLAAYKMRVDCATNGPEAIRKIRENSYDIVFMDHMMPHMDGVEAVRRIRALADSNRRGEWYKELPIVALTANAVPGVSAFFLSNGFNDYLAKPVDVVKLDKILAKWIPKTKQQAHSDTRLSENADDALAAQKFSSIKGLDAAKGILQAGGTEAGFRRVLSSFVKDAEERLPLLAEGDAASFAAHLHALKGACAAVGSDLYVLAANLEAAVQNGGAERAARDKNEFCARLAALTDDIKRVLNEPADGAGKMDAPSLAAHLDALAAALQSKRMREADKALAHIESLADGNPFAEPVAAISDAVLLGAYDDAVIKIGELRRTLR
jgi:CheY-like chemotaxis protein